NQPVRREEHVEVLAVLRHFERRAQKAKEERTKLSGELKSGALDRHRLRERQQHLTTVRVELVLRVVDVIQDRIERWIFSRGPEHAKDSLNRLRFDGGRRQHTEQRAEANSLAGILPQQNAESGPPFFLERGG